LRNTSSVQSGKEAQHAIGDTVPDPKGAPGEGNTACNVNKAPVTNKVAVNEPVGETWTGRELSLRGRRMNLSSETSTTQSSKIPVIRPTLDSVSLLADQFSLFKLAREEKRPLDESFHAVLSESAQELATLLRELQIPSDAVLGGSAQSQPNSDLLMRAVQCAVKQHMLQTELSSLAFTDELTGLYNRRGFLSLSERQLKITSRSGCVMGLFYIDVDGLKRINDSLGHSVGDLALMSTAEVLRMTFRESDVVARLGGDEFGVLAVEDSSLSEASIMARLRESLKTIRAQKSRYRLSLSVGVVQFNSSATTTIAEFMFQADRAMYQAKRKRRRFIGRSEPRACSAGFAESIHRYCPPNSNRKAGVPTPDDSRASWADAIPITATAVRDEMQGFEFRPETS
jgi:diguanylate cyclase (GGDEF)-like protein